MTLLYDESMLNRPNYLGEVTLSPSVVEDYLTAIGIDTLPSDEHGPLLPPLLGMAFVGDLPEIRLQFGSKGFLAGQVYYPLAPIRPGDVLATTTTLVDVYEKTGRSGRLAFAVFDTELTTPDGHVVARCRRSYVRQE